MFRRGRTAFAGAFAALLIVISVLGSQAQAAGITGISDENLTRWSPAAVSAFNLTEVKQVRHIVGWDVALHPQQLADEKEWIRIAEQDRHLEVMISFGINELFRGPHPNLVDYAFAVGKFRREQPQIKLYTAWNEPNHHRGPRSADHPETEWNPADEPELAANYWRTLNSICTPDFGTPCRVLGGDFIDPERLKPGENPDNAGKGLETYLHRYQNQLAQGNGPQPTIWAIHPYGTIKQDPTFAQGVLDRRFMSQIGGARVWFTEVGGMVCEQGEEKGGPSNVDPEQSVQFQTASAQRLLNLLQHEGSRVERAYYYELAPPAGEPFACQGPGTGKLNQFDSALLGGDDFVRPVYKVLFPSVPGPVVETRAPTNVAARQGTLNGAVDALGLRTRYRFEYGPTTSYGSTFALQATGTGQEAFSEVLTGLAPNQTIHYRIVAEGPSGNAVGADQVLQTPATPPQVQTGSVSAIEESDAVLEGDINPREVATTYHFDYGIEWGDAFPGSKGTFEHHLPEPEASAGSGSTLGHVTLPVSELIPGFLYHYRLVATSSSGTTIGEEKFFQTLPPPPSAGIQPPSIVRSDRVTLNGTVAGNGSPTHYHFDWGETEAYGNSGPVPDGDGGSRSAGNPVSLEITGLKEETTYFFRIVVENVRGRDEARGSFRTPTFSSTGAIPSFLSGFATTGTGSTTNAPADVEVDPATTNILVANRGSNRVEVFSSAGAPLSSFGSSGSGDGQLNAPRSLALDSKGNIWVADSGNKRIQMFNSKGEFQLKCGSAGTGIGQFSSSGPVGIAVDARDNVWVTDRSGRVQKFTGSCDFLGSVGSAGTGNGQFTQSAGIDIAAGKVWVTDFQANRVSVFSEAGSFLFGFGSSGDGLGQLNGPDGIDVDARGNVWVLQANSNRVSQFNLAGSYVTRFGAAGSGSEGFSFQQPAGLASDGVGRVLVADSGNKRIQKWQVPNYAPSPSVSITGGTGENHVTAPADVEVDPASGNILVADLGNNRIETFDSSRAFVSKFGSAGSGNGQFSAPRSLALDSKGNIWVADSGNKRIQKFNSKGEFLLKCGSEGTGSGQFSSSGPKGVAVDAKDNVWVTDYSGRVQKFTESCGFLGSVGSAETGVGQLTQSAGIDIAAGKVWVTDLQANRVTVFSEAGAFLFRFGSTGTIGLGQLNGADGIDVDERGNVWVLEVANNRISQFNQAGGFVSRVGSKGTILPNQMNLAAPASLTTDGQGGLLLSDTKNNRIATWRIPPDA
ncbi:MAG TPA: hypothetical protein VFX45_10110 [Solirubrobacterales bacterium]|nr:hypothetical protein [Solirubrobacterales bacterium]